MVELASGREVDSERYLRSLNEVFGSWGGAEQYRWAFERDAGAGPADLMVFHDDGKWLAGSAVSYRVVVDGAGGSSTMGIMTGSWTLPAARGRGLFTRIIERSVELVSERGGSHLLAFVTHDNASRRRLEAAGAWMIPTSYVFSTPETPPSSYEPWEETQVDDAQMLWSHAEAARSGRAHIAYPDARAFGGQFLERAGDVRVLRSAGGDLAVLEVVDGNARLQLLVPVRESAGGRALASVLAYAQRAGLDLFFFRPGDQSAVAEHLGMARKAGFMTIIPVGPESVRSGAPPATLIDWSMDSGDRM